LSSHAGLDETWQGTLRWRLVQFIKIKKVRKE